MEVDHLLNRPPANRTERYIVAGEHDAVDRGPVESVRVIVRSLKISDTVRMRSRCEQRRIKRALLAKESRHLGFGSALSPQLCAAGLQLTRVRLEPFLRPWRRDRHSRRDEVLPLEIVAIEKRGDVCLPRLDDSRGRLVRHR